MAEIDGRWIDLLSKESLGKTTTKNRRQIEEKGRTVADLGNGCQGYLLVRSMLPREAAANAARYIVFLKGFMDKTQRHRKTLSLRLNYGLR